MITIEPWVFTVVIVCIVASVGSVAFLFGSWRSPMYQAAKNEAMHWKGRYYKAEQDIKALAGELGGDAPIGSQNGLAELASLFLKPGEQFSIGGILQTLKENPEAIPQILKLLGSGIIKRKNGTGGETPKPNTLPDGRVKKVLN